MQNQNISDVIEAYLKKILEDSEQVEIRRSEVAELFHCVPSQINYVIKTRFTPKQGYIVQSKRGGGGYIRIQKAQFMDDHELLDQMVENVPATISQRDALAVVQRLYDEEIIDRKTSNIILATLSHQTLNVGSKKIEDGLRARLLVAILESLRYESK